MHATSLLLHRRGRHARAGFTLVELLVTISIVAILAVVSFLGMRKATEFSRRAACAANLHQIHAAFLGYMGDNNNMLPPAQTTNRNYAYAYLAPYTGSPDLTIYGGNSSGSGMFCCPALKGRVGEKIASGANNYALNTHIWESLGDSKNLDRPYHGVSFTRLTQPVRTILVGDVCYWGTANHPFGVINRSLPPGVVYGVPEAEAKVHTNGAANLLFADGHVEYWNDTTVLTQSKYYNKGPDDVWNPQK